MQPTPLTTALPKLAAQIDAERPLISAALLDILVTEIGDEWILTEVTTQHSYDILTSPAQHEYLHKALSRHWNKDAAFFLSLHIPAEPPTPQAPSPTPSDHKRTANTLTFTERAALQHWMSQGPNAAFVATESDNDAATQASAHLDMPITAGNILSMRKILGIEKVKPTKPTPQPPLHDIDLVALHAKVEVHDLQLATLEANNLASILSGLRNSLVELENRIKSLEASDD